MKVLIIYIFFRSYRRELVEFCHSRDYDLCFLESITDDLNLIQLYIAGIEQSNPDYLNMSREAAVVKFENHFRDYADSYEQLDEQVGFIFYNSFFLLL